MSLQSSLPYKNTFGNVLSKWIAVNGQLTASTVLVVRTDMAVGISGDGTTTTVTGGSMPTMVAGDMVYILSPYFNGTYKIISYSGTGFTFLSPFNGSESGTVNFISGYPNYYIKVRFHKYDLQTMGFLPVAGEFIYKPNNLGIAKIDIAPILRNLVGVKDTFVHSNSIVNLFDNNLSAFIQMEMTEGWMVSGVPTDVGYSGVGTFNIVNGAMQVQHKYAENMAMFVPDSTGFQGEEGKFITDFKRPTYFEGFPFDISFLYDENINDVPWVKRFVESYTNDTAFMLDDDVLTDLTPDYMHRLLCGKIRNAVTHILLWLGYDGQPQRVRYVGEDYVDEDYVEVI